MKPNYDALWYWVRERQALADKRAAGSPFPWTDDSILKKWRFCNVRREDDRVTKWIDDRIRKAYAKHPNLWFMLCIARQINWPATLHKLIINGKDNTWPFSNHFSPQYMGAMLKAIADSGEKVFTGAYIITAPSTKGVSKAKYVAETTLGELWNDRAELAPIFQNGKSLEVATRMLRTYTGWGNFLSYQAVVDMRFCPALLGKAKDIDTWAAAGPGTIRGLNRVYNRKVDASLLQNQALDEMLPIFERCYSETGVRIDLSDVPNILCETDKYLRVANGEGTPRARFQPPVRRLY